MRFLPKANPLHEKILATKIVIPELMEKLGRGAFTGYLSHSSPGFEACCLFAKGKLLCAVSSDGGRVRIGFEAIVLLFSKVFSSGGEINVYRMTPDIAVCTHALLIGPRLFNGDEVRQVDIKSVLSRLKGQGMNGVVLFYTIERFAMMFFKDGLPIGFYHDNSTVIESLPDESRKVAALPASRMDVCSTKPLEELLQYDLLQMVNLEKLWETAQSRHAATLLKEEVFIANVVSKFDDRILIELVEDVAEVASAYLSRTGREIIEKRLKEGGGAMLLLDRVKLDLFLNQIEGDARAADSQARIDEMIELMKSEITGRLAV